MTAIKKTQKAASTAAASNAMKTDDVLALFGDLEKRRVDWEDNQLRASNNVLYPMLASCYELYLETQAFKPVRKTVIDAYDAKFGKADARLTILTRIVRMVFGIKNSNRVFNYVTALKIAHEYKAPKQSIPQFFEAAGGVEFVRRNRKPANVLQDEQHAKIKAVTDVLEEIAPFAHNIKIKLPKSAAEKNAAHSFTAILMREEEDGTFSAVMISQRQSTVNAMLAEYSAQTEEERKVDQAARTVLTAKPSRRAAVASARAA